MKYLMMFVLVFFVGCGSSNSSLNLKDDKNISTAFDVNSSLKSAEVEAFQEFIYDKNSTKEQITFLFKIEAYLRIHGIDFTENYNVVFPEHETLGDHALVLSDKEALDKLIDKLTDDSHMHDGLIAAEKVDSSNLDIYSNVIEKLKSVDTDFKSKNIVIIGHYDGSGVWQVVTSLDDQYNMNIHVENMSHYSNSSFGLIYVFLVSKEVSTVNGVSFF